MIQRPGTVTPEQALVRLERLCVRSEHCTWELRRKLEQWRIAPGDADRIMASLVGRRFVDDIRFAVAFIRDKYRFARWGRRRIAMALRQKHVNADALLDDPDVLDPEQYAEILDGLIAAKARTLDMADRADRQRLFRFGVSRGYEPDMVISAIRRIK